MAYTLRRETTRAQLAFVISTPVARGQVPRLFEDKCAPGGSGRAKQPSYYPTLPLCRWVLSPRRKKPGGD